MARMEHFTARLVDVRHVPGDGVEWVEIEFAPGAISQVETVLIRVDPWSCDRSAFLTDAVPASSWRSAVSQEAAPRAVRRAGM